MWAILTEPDKQGNRWKLDEFLGTGTAEVASVMAYLAQTVGNVRRSTALDFGCGVGRLTQALAAHFENVTGVDISAAMIDRAVALNRHPDRCRYVVNTVADLRTFADGTFDFVYSNITLQHIAPRYSRAYIREFVRVAAPGGVILFQLPSERVPVRVERRGVARVKATIRDRTPEAVVNAYDDFKRWLSNEPTMEGHGIARDEVVSVLLEAGARVADVQDDASAGPLWVSHRYCAVRTGR